MLQVSSVKEAWAVAKKMFPSDYMQDERASKNAGYPIFRSTVKDSLDHISDLGYRLELNIGNESKNIWIRESEQMESGQMERKIRREIQMTEHRIGFANKMLDGQKEHLIEMAQRKDRGMWITQIGEEMEKLESEILQLKQTKQMLEYFLNDEAE